MRTAIASSSQLAADAGAEITELGGNAVDAALAASLVQLVTEPGVVSLGAGAFIVLWPPGGRPVMIDAASEMPGRGAKPDDHHLDGIDVMLPYGGGTPTTVGYASVATPGALAGYELAAQCYGKLPWRTLVAPAARLAAEGFPLGLASERYISLTHDGIFGWNPSALEPLRDETGALKGLGDTIRVAHLADSLELIGREGTAAFYEHDIAESVDRDMADNGGLLRRQDLAAYQPRVVAPLQVELDDWALATAAPPSVGGAALAAMLLLLRATGEARWSRGLASQIIEVQKAVMRYRAEQLDVSEQLDADVAELLRMAARHPASLFSPSTVHTSTVDDEGLACAITASAGYGSGVLVPGTGIWLNNSLGEVELNRRGFHALAPGERIPSNMAPTVGRSSRGETLSIGSPGADRITTAILQTLINFVHLGMPLEEAVNHPRLHVEWPEAGVSRVAFEPGLPVPDLPVASRGFEELDMFFGGVSATCAAPPDLFQIAADVRRAGGTSLGRSADS
jgi:gamma-glutamyltranspeptidase/glutathione hydrolase